MKKFFIALVTFFAGFPSLVIAQNSSDSSPVLLIAQNIHKEQEQHARSMSVTNTFSPSTKRERAIDTYSQETVATTETTSFQDQIGGVQLLQRDGSVHSYSTKKKNWFNE